MIRLAISGAALPVIRKIAARLRGAILQPDPVDAAVFLGPALPDVDGIERLLDASKHVLLAAESGPTADALDRLSAAATRAGVRLDIVNPDRYLPSRQLIRQQLTAGTLGEFGLIRLHRWASATTDEGPLPTALVRDLDLVVWLASRLPNLVYALANARFVQVHLGFPGGGMALIDTGECLPTGDGYDSLSVIGSTGAACADDHHNRQLLFLGGCPRAVRTGEGYGHLAALVEEFVDSLHAGQGNLDSVTAWRQALVLADVVNRSLASRGAIRLEGP
jgi:predicted dehydrogenase